MVAAAVWGEAGIVAVHHPRGDSETPAVSILFSADGVSWTQVPGFEGLGYVGGLAVSDAGYLMFEDRGDSRPARVWFSADGTTWTEASAPTGQLTGLVTGWREGFVFVTEEFEEGATSTTQTLWGSDDGQMWTAFEPAAFDEFFITGIQGSSMGLMATAIPAHDHEGDGEEVVEIPQHLLYSADGVEWADWLVEDTFAINEVGGFAIGTDRMVGSVINAEESDFDAGLGVWDVWVGASS